MSILQDLGIKDEIQATHRITFGFTNGDKIQADIYTDLPITWLTEAIVNRHAILLVAVGGDGVGRVVAIPYELWQSSAIFLEDIDNKNDR